MSDNTSNEVRKAEEAEILSDPLMQTLRNANPVDISRLPSPQSEGARNQLQEILMLDQENTPIQIGSDPESRAKFSSADQKFARYQKRSRTMMAAAAVFILLAVSAVVVIKPWGTSSASAVQNAASQSKKAQTGKAVVTASVIEGSEVEELGQVVAEFDGRNFDVVLKSSEFIGEEERLKYVDGVGYFQQGDNWIGVKAPDFAQRAIGSFADPGKVFEIVEDLSEVNEVGKESLDGVEVTHYRGVVQLADLSAAASQAFGLSGLVDMQEDVSDLEGQIDLDIYIDDEGFLYRVDSLAEHPEESSKLSGSIVFSDFGEEINIEAPADYEEIIADEEIIGSLI